MIKDNKNKVMAAIAAVAIGAAGVGAGFMLDNPATIVEKQIEYINQMVEVPGETVFVEVPVEVEKIVKVDNGDLDLVLTYLEDNFDNKLVFEDVRDIVDNIKMEDSYQNKALDMFEADYKDYVSVPNGYSLSDASIIKLRDETVKAYSYEDKEFKVTFEAEIVFEDEDTKVTKFYDVTYDFDLDRDDNEDVEVSVVIQ